MDGALGDPKVRWAALCGRSRRRADFGRCGPDRVGCEGFVDGDGGSGAVGGGEYHLMRHRRRATHVAGGPHEWVAGGPGVVR